MVSWVGGWVRGVIVTWVDILLGQMTASRRAASAALLHAKQQPQPPCCMPSRSHTKVCHGCASASIHLLVIIIIKDHF